MPLKIVFAGTPDFAVPSLQTLIDSDHDVIAVYTQPDRPAGRGRQLQASPVKQLAELHQLPIYQPKSLRNEEAQAELRALAPDLMIVVAYGLILPQAVLDIPKLGCVNVHPSLLPRWRGAAPIQRTIEAGDSVTGVTIMQLDAGMDTGPILRQTTYQLSGDESSADLHDYFSSAGAALLLETINGLAVGEIIPQAQDDELATHADKINKQEAVLDWSLSAIQLMNKVRAFNPWPVAQTTFIEKTLRVWSASALPGKTELSPGTLVAVDKDSFIVATGDGLLQVSTVQMPGKKQMTVADFIRGYGSQLIVGETRFG